MNESVVGVVVTFNRLSLLKNCIASLKSQSRKLDQLIVVNNGSTDGTDSWLNEQQGLTVIHQENSGGAGGFHRGIKEAYESGYDWIWVMDDDCVASENCLELMIASDRSKEALCIAPLVINNNGDVDIRHRGYFNLSPGMPSFQTSINAVNTTDILVDFASFVGLMINRAAIEKVGFPIKEFFIHNDDIEYCLRLNQVSKILLSTEAKIFHLENATNTDVQKKFLNHYRHRTPIEKLWIKYYGIRNSVWIKRNYIYNGSILKKASLFWFITKSLSAHFKDIMLYDDHKYKRFSFYLNAYKDGWFEKFDNEKPKRILSSFK